MDQPWIRCVALGGESYIYRKHLGCLEDYAQLVFL